MNVIVYIVIANTRVVHVYRLWIPGIHHLIVDMTSCFWLYELVYRLWIPGIHHLIVDMASCFWLYELVLALHDYVSMLSTVLI